MALRDVLDSGVRAVERANVLDRASSVLTALGRPLRRSARVTDVLSGTPIGHPLHPAVVALPVGLLAGAHLADIAGDPVSARRALGAGLLCAVPATLSGVSDWSDTEGPEKRVGAAHALANAAALACYGASWWSRRRPASTAARWAPWAAVGGGAALAVGGYLGGHLGYAYGVGVDTTAFQQLPEAWTDAGAAADVVPGAPAAATVGGVPIVILRTRTGVFALADRCTHRGGPLSEGRVDGTCVVCPWHDSAFAVDTGAVRRGPATRPQPVLEVRERDGRIEVRRAETRSLRTNPTGV